MRGPQTCITYAIANPISGQVCFKGFSDTAAWETRNAKLNRTPTFVPVNCPPQRCLIIRCGNHLINHNPCAKACVTFIYTNTDSQNWTEANAKTILRLLRPMRPYTLLGLDDGPHDVASLFDTPTNCMRSSTGATSTAKLTVASSTNNGASQA